MPHCNYKHFNAINTHAHLCVWVCVWLCVGKGNASLLICLADCNSKRGGIAKRQAQTSQKKKINKQTKKQKQKQLQSVCDICACVSVDFNPLCSTTTTTTKVCLCEVCRPGLLSVYQIRPPRCLRRRRHRLCRPRLLCSCRAALLCNVALCVGQV